MKLEVDENLIRRFDLTTAVLVAVADSADLWPVKVSHMVQTFPYLDHRTIRTRFDSLAKEGVLQKVMQENVPVYEK